MKEGVNGGENGLSEAITRCLPVVLRKGVNGGKREGERSERESVVPRQKKEGVTERKQPNELPAK